MILYSVLRAFTITQSRMMMMTIECVGNDTGVRWSVAIMMLLLLVQLHSGEHIIIVSTYHLP